MKINHIIASFFFLLISCTPSETAIQTAIAETQQANPITENAFMPEVQPSDGPPSEALRLAISELDTELYFWEGTFLSSRSHDVDDILLERSQQLVLNRAEKLNGLKQKWCLLVFYLWYDSETEEYMEMGAVYQLLQDSSEEWKAIGEAGYYYDVEGNRSSYNIDWGLCLFK